MRFQVSAARSAAKDWDVISTAVRQTPLTAMLSPGLEFLVQLGRSDREAAIAIFLAMPATRPTSSMMPVNMDCIVAPASRRLARGRPLKR